MCRAWKRKRRWHGWLAAALLLIGPLCAGAQSAAGSIEGVVVDPSGAVLPGVTITLAQSAVGVERTAVTGTNGFFHAPLLPVGAYDLTASLPGFATLRRTDLRLTINNTIGLRLEMVIAGVVERVDVSGAAPIVDRSRSSVSALIDETSIRNLPVNGRNFLDFVLLTPGVTRDVRSGDLSFAGQRGSLNSLIIDGADSNNTFFGQTLARTGSGRAPYQFSMDAVQEFQVNANSFAAEYGRAAGGVINVVTKSGSNHFRGSLFEFYRDKTLNATNAIDAFNGLPKSPYHYHQFGGTLGGPLRVNRDFFFVAYDGQRNTQPNPVVLNVPPGTPDDNATRAGIELLRPLADSWRRTLDQDVFLIKTDHQVTNAHRLTVRYNDQNFTGDGFESIGPQNASEHTGASLVRTRVLNASWAALLGANRFNELRMQFARDNETGTANSDQPEAVIFQGGTPVLVIGRNSFSPRANILDRVQIADVLMWSRGSHTFKAGGDLQIDSIDNFFPGLFGGRYVFRSLASFARGRPDNIAAGEQYLQNFAGDGMTGAHTGPDVRDLSLFVQDEWRPTADATVNFGLRYDLMTVAAPSVRNPDAQLTAAGVDTSRFDADTDNWGPRLGIAWTPRGRPHVLRGGWGLFYGRTPALPVTTAHTNNGISIVSRLFTGDLVPTYPERFADVPSRGIPLRSNISYIDRGFENPRLMHANAALEWQLRRDATIAITYLFVDGKDLPRWVDRNLGTLLQRTFTIAGSDQTVAYPFFSRGDRPFTNFERVIAFQSSAESRYNGLTVELNRRFAVDGAQLRLSYTLGKVVDTVPEAGGDDAAYASDPVDSETDRTVGNNDRRHRFVASGVYASNRLARRVDGKTGALARDWLFSAIVGIESGKPFSARVFGVDLNGDGNTRNDLAPGTRRNDFRLPTVVTVDARIARDLTLTSRLRAQIIWEAFNLFNRDNFDGVDPILYNVAIPTLTLTPLSTFGRPVSSAGERIMQLAVKVLF